MSSMSYVLSMSEEKYISIHVKQRIFGCRRSVGYYATCPGPTTSDDSTAICFAGSELRSESGRGELQDTFMFRLRELASLVLHMHKGS